MNASDKVEKPDRTRATMFRVIYQHQDSLLGIADYKAGMIISICTMIISAIIAIIGYGVVTGRGEAYIPTLILPVICIVFSCMISLILAIQAARPKLILHLDDKNENAPKSSLLFFGIMAGYTQQDYISRMKTLMESSDSMYEHMIIDLHNQGIILKRKFHLLQYAYLVLVVGFLLSAMSCIIFLLLL